jgi:hypothetical protein
MVSRSEIGTYIVLKLRVSPKQNTGCGIEGPCGGKAKLITILRPTVEVFTQLIPVGEGEGLS